MGSNIFLYFISGSTTRFWQPTTNYGSPVGAVHGRIESITEKLSSKYAVHFLPTADKDLIQKLGKNNRYFTIKGILTTYQYGFCWTEGGAAQNEPDAAFFRDMVGYTGSFIFYNAFSTSDILTGGREFAFWTSTNVLWTGVDFEDKAGRPMERRFTISAVEIR